MSGALVAMSEIIVETIAPFGKVYNERWIIDAACLPRFSNTWMLNLPLADPVVRIPQHEAEDYIIHLLADTAGTEGGVEML